MTISTESHQSLERYVAIIDVFSGLHANSPPPHGGTRAYGVTEMSRALGLSKGTMSRYLRRLEDVGLLDRLADRRYALSTRLYHWGQAATPSGNLRIAARSVMEALAHQFGETVSLFVLDTDAAVCIDQVDGLHPVRLSAAVGRRLPLHTGSSPRLLLAFAPAKRQEAFLSQGPYPRLATGTMTDADQLHQALAATREVGYVVSVGESNDGVVGVAAPIREANGGVCAALSIAGPLTRLNPTRQSEILAGVVTGTENISRALGYLSPDYPGGPVRMNGKASSA